MERALRRLLSLFLFIPGPAAVFAQCSFPLQLHTSKDYCLGSSLLVSSSHMLKKIVWYHDGHPVDSSLANMSLDTTGIKVADVYMESICTDDADNLYASSADWSIKIFKPGSTSGTTVAGGHGQGSAANQTFGTETIYVDDQYNIYESDMYNYRVQKWRPGASAGTTLFTFGPDYFTFEPHATLFDCRGDVFLIHYEDSTIREWTAGSTAPVTYAPLPPLWNGYFAGNVSLQMDSDGNVLVLDQTPGLVWRWNPASGSWTRLLGTSLPAGATPKTILAADFWADGDDTVYLLSASTNQLLKYGPGDQQGMTVINEGTAGITNSMCLTRDKRGDLFIGSQQDHKVLKFKMTSSIDTSFTPTEPGQYYAVVKDMLGYSRTTDTVYLNTPQAGPPSITITATATSTPVCTPISFAAQTSNAGPDPAYQWEVSGVKAGTDSPSYTYNLFADSDYIYCILKAPAGCTGALFTDTSNIITLRIDPHGAATVRIVASDTAICAKTPVVFTAIVTNAAAQPSFQWLLNGAPVPGDDTAAYHTDSLNDGDVLTCLITSDDVCGLAKSNSIPVHVSAPPTIAPNQVFTIRYGQNLTLDPLVTGNIVSWLWMPGTSLSDSTIENPIATPETTTDYKLRIVSAGCGADSGYILVNVYTPLSIPNAFTPNGDGHNDLFYVLGGPTGSKVEELSVFDRWGQIVFQAHDASPGDRTRGWNGYLHGQPAPPDTYVYQIVMRFDDGSRQVYKGTVILIR